MTGNVWHPGAWRFLGFAAAAVACLCSPAPRERSPRGGGAVDTDSLLIQAHAARRPERVVALCTRVLSDRPDNVDALLLRGTAWARLSVADDALIDLRRALRLDSARVRVQLDEPARARGVTSVVDNLPAFVRALGESDTTSFSLSSARKGATRFSRRSGHGRSSRSGGIPTEQVDSGATTTTSASTTATVHTTPRNNESSRAASPSEADAGATSSLDDTSSAAIIRRTSRHSRAGDPAFGDTSTSRIPADRSETSNTTRTKTSETPASIGSAALDPRAEVDSCLRAPGMHSRAAARAYCEAMNVYGAGEYRKAVRGFGRALDHESDFILALLGRAKARGMLGAHRRGLRDVKRALAIDPESAAAYMVQAWIHHLRGRYRREAQSLYRALDLGYRYPGVIRVRLELIDMPMPGIGE